MNKTFTEEEIFKIIDEWVIEFSGMLSPAIILKHTPIRILKDKFRSLIEK